MLKKTFIFILFTFSVLTVWAQKANIRGVVTDTVEKRKLENSAILLIRSSDSAMVKTTRADRNGKFELKNLSAGDYKILISYPKMADYIRNLRISDTSNIVLGDVNMELKSKVLKEVVIQATKSAVRMKGDTLVFQADSFAVRANANVQELLKRLPGIEVDKSGTIKAQGKMVKTVLVDGDEFFGDDPLLATKYLKANAVEEIQVYDKKSKSADLTGIDDGIKNKTINIKLKDNAKNGYLATIDLNTNVSDLGDYGGMAGIFKNKLKAAIYGNYSNLNNESKINNSMRKLKGEEYDLIEVGDDGSSIMYVSGDDDEDYIAASGGLPNNFGIGAYYADKFSKDKMGLKLNFKSFDNNNVNLTTTNSQELLPNETKFFSSGRTANNANVAGESVKGTFNYNTDAKSILKISFGASRNRNENTAVGGNETRGDNGIFISQNKQENTGNGHSDIFNGNINWSRKFEKKGRTISIDLQPESQNSNSTENSTNRTVYFNASGDSIRVENTDLRKKNTGKQNSIGMRVNYTDRLTKRWTFETGYSFKTISSGSNRLVFDNIASNPKKIDSLSNDFKFINFSNVGKMIWQYSYENFSISSGLEATQTNFELKDLDKQTDFERSYLNLSPRTNLLYKINNSNTLAVNYNGYMQQPSIDQLQPVRQINTPLYQIIGNSALRPSFTNSFGLSYNSFQFNSDQYISAYFNYGFTNNAIVSTELVDDFNKRISSFINANGNNSISGNLSYSKGFSKSHLRFGIDVGFNRSNTIAIINATQNKAANTQYNLRGSLNYYTQQIEFSYIPSASVMTGKSSIGEINDGRSLTHNHEISGTVQLPFNAEFNTSFSLSFRPANASFGQDLNTAIWNSYLSAKLLKSEALEIKLSVTDILNQKIGYNRFVGGNVTSEDTFSYIPRYVLIGLNWNLSGNFIKKTTER
ncbi:outer membrane beta-barrel family protein [Pedobacter africanus]|uniref:CarboxypepD_reg-like domain-containing protein n=1 Tax=Pedobacter africanus TaxID=151894 RepID=A0A1W2CIZ7_9SPHI|nr:outer membrane beta-barrel family protein [Pedobacter africanus]SMC84608.1 CarboxypepD_reg-like domain-containing protein [Pedobacter africanus]